MTEKEPQTREQSSGIDPVESRWGNPPDNNFGYATEEERHAKRGLEDWELLDKMSESQPGLFDWMRTVVGSVIIGIVAFVITAYGVYFIVHNYGWFLLGRSAPS